ncbi:zinc finger protein 235-like isoform X2 [Rhincodon typus]|uniref:zinc finger protein 235-like isoform X2 n=1 Tax=Rhincodon typus TaxID=259920 RepID=UPI00202FC558|nr:zinc finger protein 235-like isoform X2 [Rhincodon typus]
MPFYSFSIGYYWPLKDIRRGGFSNAPSHQDLMESPILSQMEHDQILNLEGKSSIHTGEKLYTCCVCGQGFSESSDHTNHKCSHTGVKLWKCGDLGRNSFPHLSWKLIDAVTPVTGHLPAQCVGRDSLSHLACWNASSFTLTRPFQSPDCGKCFRTSQNLMSRQLARINERPFKCQDCGKCYKTSGNLVSHQHVHTKERPFKY